jgi:hypothetical protein
MASLKTSFSSFVCTLVLSFSALSASGQQIISGPEPQTGVVTGTVTDADGAIIPGATVTLDGPDPGEHRVVVANESGFFELKAMHPAVAYRVTVNAKGFSDWTSPELNLTPGQQLDLPSVKLVVGTVETSVSAVFSEQVAMEQVKAEEKQRVFGIIPNFYVVYDHNFVPLPTKLKYQLAFRASTDIVSIAGAAILAGAEQAANTPDYVQGAKGYGQRFGAVYADAFTNIMIGGAVLPSLLHQDPRYFYQGEGTKKSRAMHALSSPFICKGDNGKPQINFSSIGGDLSSGAISNLYYPRSNRGASLVFGNALISTGGRALNALAQEFVLRHFTSRPKKED